MLDQGLPIHLHREDNRDVNVDQVFERIVVVPKLVDVRLVNVWEMDECVGGHECAIS